MVMTSPSHGGGPGFEFQRAHLSFIDSSYTGSVVVITRRCQRLNPGPNPGQCTFFYFPCFFTVFISSACFMFLPLFFAFFLCLLSCFSADFRLIPVFCFFCFYDSFRCFLSYRAHMCVLLTVIILKQIYIRSRPFKTVKSGSESDVHGFGDHLFRFSRIW